MPPPGVKPVWRIWPPGLPQQNSPMSDAAKQGNPPPKAQVDPMSTIQEKSPIISRFPGLEDEYTKAELHNGIVLFADIREFSSYIDGNSDYAISLLACFRRVLSQFLSAKSLKANENERYTTFAKELGDGVMMMWIAEQGSITDISVEEITGLAFVAQEIVRRFFDLSADFAPEKYHVGIGIAIGSFQRLLYRDKNNPTLFRYRDYCGSTINMAARLESLSRPNGVTLCFNALPLNKKKEIESRLGGKGFKEATQEIRGIGKTRLFQWIYNLDAPNGNESPNVSKGNPTDGEQPSVSTLMVSRAQQPTIAAAEAKPKEQTLVTCANQNSSEPDKARPAKTNGNDHVSVPEPKPTGDKRPAMTAPNGNGNEQSVGLPVTVQEGQGPKPPASSVGETDRSSGKDETKAAECAAP